MKKILVREIGSSIIIEPPYQIIEVRPSDSYGNIADRLAQLLGDINTKFFFCLDRERVIEIMKQRSFFKRYEIFVFTGPGFERINKEKNEKR